MATNINTQLDRFRELAQKISDYTDKAEKKTAFESVLNKINNLIPDAISSNLQTVQDYTKFYLQDYLTCKYNSFGEGVDSLIRFVDSNIDEIQLFENDSEETRKARKIKSLQFRQMTFSREKIVKIIKHMGVRNYDEKITEPDPDWPYSQYGTYTKYLSFKSHRYFPICLNIKISNCADFETVNYLILLYIALNNELNIINEELELLGVLPIVQKNNLQVKYNFNMNYKQVITNGCVEHANQKTSFASYFKQQAQINKRDNFVEFVDFFNGCRVAVKGYEKIIRGQYEKEISDCNFMINSFKAGRVNNENGKLITDQVELDKGAEEWTQQRQSIIDRGINSANFKCNVLSTGEITNDMSLSVCCLYHSDIIALEQGIAQSEQELLKSETPPLAISNSGNSELESLYKFIDFLEGEQSKFIEKKQIFDELSKLGEERNKLKRLESLSDKLKYDAIQKSISDKFNEINPLYDRIRNKLAELNIHNRLDNIESAFKMNATEEQAKQMMSYLNKYISCRKATDGMLIFGLDSAIRNIDEVLKELYKFISGTDAKEFDELIASTVSIKISLSGRKADEQTESVDVKKERAVQITTGEIKELEVRKLFKPALNNKISGTNQTKADRIIGCLKVERNTTKAYAEIALMFYRSKLIEDNSKSFKDWLSHFYDLVGVIKKSEYKESKLSQPKGLKEEFQYLF